VLGAVFDLDGVLIDSEHIWEEAWRACCARHGVPWTSAHSRDVQGMSSREWSSYIATTLAIPERPSEIADLCVEYFVRRVVDDGAGPLLPGARDLLDAVAGRLPTALASSAARPAIDAVLEHHGLTARFTSTVSSDEVARGKPSPDGYLEATSRLGLDATCCVAVEDSTNGILAARAAGLIVVAIPNPRYPPRPEAIAVADHVAHSHADAKDLILSIASQPSVA
jgi:HAD superfamily hydrolase (TIGR01509 family)